MLLGAAIALTGVAAYSALTDSDSESAIRNSTSPVKSDTRIDVQDQAYQQDSSDSYSERADPTPVPSAAKPSTSYKAGATNASCTGTCIERLTQKLNDGAYLDQTDIDLIFANTLDIAAILAQQPEQLSNIETSLENPENDQAKDALLFLLSKLPKEQILQSARNLNASNNAQTRIAGLHLLESALGVDQSINTELNFLISTETDKDVLLNAIKIINELRPDDVDSSTRNRLSNVIHSNNNDKLKSAALLAQTSAAIHDEDLREGLGYVLTSQSTDLKLTGLQALDQVLQRQQFQPDRGNWKADAQFREYVSGIANDQDANIALRIEALNLMGRYYR